MAVPSPSKSDLRIDALGERRAFARSLSAPLRAELEAELARLVLPRLIGARVVAGYHPLRDEISPYPILEALGDGQTAALPWFAARDSLMIFRKGLAAEHAPWGVLQPKAASEAVPPNVVLVQIVPTARSRARLGHGPGPYKSATTR